MGRKDIKQKMNQTQTAMQIFEYQGNEVRTIQHGDEVWWVLKDVCRVLSLSTPHKVAERLEEDERNLIPLIDSMGRTQKNTIVNEPGLYSVILRSDKPEAKTFKRWVTHEVLPSIRKTGAYNVGQELTDEEKMAHGLIAANAILQRQLKKKAMKDIPMMEFITAVIHSNSSCDASRPAWSVFIHVRLYTSDYLAGHADCALTLVSGKDGEMEVLKAFPVGEERRAINAVFDEIIQDLKREQLLTHADVTLPLSVSELREAADGQLSMFGVGRPSVMDQLAANRPADKKSPAQTFSRKNHEPEI